MKSYSVIHFLQAESPDGKDFLLPETNHDSSHFIKFHSGMERICVSELHFMPLFLVVFSSSFFPSLFLLCSYPNTLLFEGSLRATLRLVDTWKHIVHSFVHM